jgi:hypothetical protein
MHYPKHISNAAREHVPLFRIRIRATDVSKIISGAVVVATIGFTAAFIVALGGFFTVINSANGFFQSANVIMYLTIEGLFLFLVLYGTYVSVRRRDYKN